MNENSVENKEKASKKKINKTKLIWAISIVAVVVILGGYIGFAGSYDKVYPNTYLNGAEIGGFTYDEVLKIVDEASKNSLLPKEIRLSLKGEKIGVSTNDIELCYDADKTANGILSGRASKSFLGRAWDYTKSIFGENRFDIDVSYNETKFNSLISDFVGPYEEEPIDATFYVEGDMLTIDKGHDGKKLNKAKLDEDLAEYMQNPNGEIELKIEKKKSEKFNLDEFYKRLTSEPTDAYYEKTEDGEVIVVADKPKVKVSKDDIKKALEADENLFRLKVSTTPAKVTKEELEEALFSGVMGEWTSYFSASNRPRSANVALSASKINGYVLMPGEVFSYDKTVGPRTAKNGFQMAGVYINNKVENGIGGGICQTSSTLYSAVLYANLEIVERTSHSLPVSYMPPGQDATIASGSIDFKFRNNTKHPIKIVTTIDGGSIKCEILGTVVKGQKVVINNTTTAVYEPKVEIEVDPTMEKGFKTTVRGSRGYAVSSTRTVYQDEKVVSTEKLVRSVYNATPTVIKVNPEEKDVPAESLTEYSAQNQTPPPEVQEANGTVEETTEEIEETTETIDEVEEIVEV